MADLNNLEITENFDTIKTLLNSIRAQGILNTSDVDKLLTGINSKLERINTEEDIDLIKIFLSELKQNLDERHGVLLSKFGAIESLFSNLLKNSSEMLKSSEVKELFDIVATNLSVFSREVVAQKETLSDITLRIDAMRSDDSQKKEIIKNVALLKNDLERLTNGFDSIVLSLNENFKSVIKIISGFDNSESFNKFGKELADISNSSNTILSALQMLDKKNIQIEEAIKGLATHDELNSAKKWISDLAIHEQSLAESIDNLADKYYKVDNLAEKIDASVEILVGLKTAISDNDDKSTSIILNKLGSLEADLKEISNDDEFEAFKLSLEGTLKEILESSITQSGLLDSTAAELHKINKSLQALDISVNFQALAANLNQSEFNIREHITNENSKVVQLVDANISKALDEITANADSLTERLGQANSLISALCEKSFAEVQENFSDLKAVVSQIDENNVSANNAIFSNITDRLTIFENSLKKSLEIQENFVKNSSNQLVEEIENIKNISGIIDYKMDSSIIEFKNTKAEYSGLKTAIDDIIALNFVDKVKDLKVDLYAVKQDIFELVESLSAETSENYANDLFGKYELLISKLDSVESEIKQTQTTSLAGIKVILDNISSSIVDVLSYVSSKSDVNTDYIESKLNDIKRCVSDNGLNYVENVRSVVEVILTQIEKSLETLHLNTAQKIDTLSSNIITSNDSIRNDIKNSYQKLLDVQDSFEEVKDVLAKNNSVLSDNITDVLSTADSLRDDFETKLSLLKSTLLDKVTNFQQEFICDNADRISELKFISENQHKKQLQTSSDMNLALKGEVERLIGLLKLNIEELNEQIAGSTLKIEGSNNEVIRSVRTDFSNKIDSSIDELEDNLSKFSADIDLRVNNVVSGFQKLESSVNDLSTNTTTSLSSTLAKILDNFVSLKALLDSLNNKTANDLKNNAEVIISEFKILRDEIQVFDENIDEDLSRQISIIESNFDVFSKNLIDLLEKNENALAQKIDEGITSIEATVNKTITQNLAQYKGQVELLFDNITEKNKSQAGYISEKVCELGLVLNQALETQNQVCAQNLTNITNDMKNILRENIELTSADYEKIRANLELFVKKFNESSNALVANVQTSLKEIRTGLRNDMNIQAQSIEKSLESFPTHIKKMLEMTEILKSELISELGNVSYKLDESKSEIMSEEIKNINLAKSDIISALISNSELLIDNLNAIDEKTDTLLTSKDFTNKFIHLKESILSNNNDNTDALVANLSELKASFELLNEKLSKEEVSRINVFQSQLAELSKHFNVLIDEAKTVTKSEVSAISETLSNNSKVIMEELEQSIEEKINSLLVTSADIAAGELQSIEIFADKIIEQVNINKQTIVACKDFINNFIHTELNVVIENIEKETDVIVKDLIEQMNLMKESQKDELSKLTVHIETSIEDYIYEHINDLKSYMDVKTDTSILNTKLDSINLELSRSVEEILAASNKLLNASVFDNAIADIRKANEIVISSMTESLNKQLQEFIISNITENIDNKLNFFDQKFTETIVEKYEEVKSISSNYNNLFTQIESLIDSSITEFLLSKDEINNNILAALSSINNNIDKLSEGFNSLKAQVLNNGLSEEIQTAISTQIQGIESLVSTQLGYLEDIADLCCDNLPELTEMNTIVKHGILTSLGDLSNKLEHHDSNLLEELNTLKADVITQFLNIFNQISFVTEQEEILDFIQDKHSELITILSHIVTTVNDIETVKDNLAVVDNKVDNLKEEIDLINEKITSIMSSDGNIDYVYSLHDLEADIAKLRLCMNSIQKNNSSQELSDLIASTNDIYLIVEALKGEISNLNVEEFKKDFDSLSEDILSISTRTNKLILASDESTKTLQENLQDFKLVINDLDERTRNFAQESGLDRIDNKLGAINSMIQNGVKTNQVFNQVFEYLAEWVDNAGAQITSISDKVETLNDIGQIKVMLEDLRAENSDNSESDELIEALGTVFDKQARKISSLEAKLDRVIVETTINNKNNRIDMSPLEETMNRFLVAIDDRMSLQQNKINSLEAKLEDVMSLINPKDTAQLTKKVGGMDRQIAKLNKSIEKIASHVVEK